MTLRFGAEYGAPPIFNPSVDDMGHVPIEDLRLSPQLSEMIINWDNQFQLTFNDDCPQESGFKSFEDLLTHNQHGKMLASLLEKELGDNVRIEFVPLK